MVKSFNSNIIILGISTLINSIIVAYSVSDYSAVSKVFIIFGCGVIFYSFLLLTIYRSLKKDDGFIKDLCLQVLDDIEKEKNVSISNLNIAKEEVASTIQQNQEKEQVKHHSNCNNGNWSVNISSLSVVDIVEGTYKAIKFISILVKKKKKVA
jgi:hypothetical protein